MNSPVSDLERLRIRTPPRGLPVMRQRWRHLGFLHWPVDPMVVAPLLPPGLELDTCDGNAYLGIVPFTVRGSRLPFLPAIPLASSFDELNFRPYVHRCRRDPGVWFFSLDAASRLAVWGARTLYKLPFLLNDGATDQPAARGLLQQPTRWSGARPAPVRLFV